MTESTTSRVIVGVSAVVLLALFSIGGTSWTNDHQTYDSMATAVPAWQFVETGSFEVSEFQELNRWLLDTERGVRSNRTPGMIAVATIAYAVTDPLTDDIEMWPATLLAVLTSWLAVLFIARSAEILRPGLWLPAVVLFGLGTATWGVASDQIWPHGPAQLALAIAVWFLVRGRDLPSGVAFGVAILIRPPVAVLAAIVGIGKAISDRSWKPVVHIGVPSVLAATIYLAHNKLLFGSWSPLALYDSLGGLGEPATTGAWFRNIVDGLFSVPHGLIVWSPWILVTTLMLPRVWPAVPGFLRWTPLAALIYLMVHFRINRVSGGLPYNYRYPLEAVTVLTPTLLFALPRLLQLQATRIIAVLAGSFAVFLQASFVFFSTCHVRADVIGLSCSLLG